MTVPVTRLPLRVRPDLQRLITKPYIPADHRPLEERTRLQHMLDRILSMAPEDAERTLASVIERYAHRHDDFEGVLSRGFSAVAHSIVDPAGLSHDVRRLIGAYFMHEYSLEAAALTNPSIVAAPDQSGVASGDVRVIVSLRAVGEGHISSIEFRTGTVTAVGDVRLDAPANPLTGSRRSPLFDRALFMAKLGEMGADADLIHDTLAHLDAQFTMANLEAALVELERREGPTHSVQHVIQVTHWLASSNYELSFPPHSDLSQRVLFPNGPSESRGMEDARLLRFTEPDGRVVYYATYTAFDGFTVLPQLIETSDFLGFRIATLNGLAARNKGIALFPRRIGGQFAALARSDGENNFLMMSDNVRFWHEAARIQVPTRPWELMQIGNSGSPIETDAGWLVLTHGVGPMREYALGALLLDIDDPCKVIGHLKEPLLVPNDEERDGYVPNVVYSCGSVVHN
ncbi:MAG: glycoside hydrolase family 130 protein, partial [Acidimicrobiia bacterium]